MSDDESERLIAPEFCIIAGCSNKRHWPEGERAGYPYCLEHLPDSARTVGSLAARLAPLHAEIVTVTRKAVREALVAHHGRWEPAAAALGVSRSTLARILREHFQPGELDELGRTLRWPTAEDRAAKARAARKR